MIYYNNRGFRDIPWTVGLCIMMIIIYLLSGVVSDIIFTERFIGIPGVITPGLITSSFAHNRFFHLLSNVLFLYYIGGQIERNLSINTYIGLICYTAIGIGCVNFLIGTAPVLGFSGINMGLLAYYYYYYNRHSAIGGQYAQLLFLNIIVGFMPGISLLGHVTGAIIGICYGKLPWTSKT